MNKHLKKPRNEEIYNDILEKTGASSATISRVNRSLQYGEDGYSVAFRRLKEQQAEEEKEAEEK